MHSLIVFNEIINYEKYSKEKIVIFEMFITIVGLAHEANSESKMKNGNKRKKDVIYE